eukprot:5762108-Pyramimonas_sp.AAC.1
MAPLRDVFGPRLSVPRARPPLGSVESAAALRRSGDMRPVQFQRERLLSLASGPQSLPQLAASVKAAGPLGLWPPVHS